MKTGRTVLIALLALVLAACGGGDRSSLTGDALANEIGCFACHTESDTGIAPTLHGIWGEEVVFDDGTSATVDEVYVRNSIADPGAQIVDGYDARMPTFNLTDDELDRLVDYVRSLG